MDTLRHLLTTSSEEVRVDVLRSCLVFPRTKSLEEDRAYLTIPQVCLLRGPLALSTNVCIKTISLRMDL
jgi:hypothetical protein